MNHPKTKGIVTFYSQDNISPASSQIDPPMPNGSSEVTELLLQLEEKVAYGQMTSEEAAQELFTKGNEIMASK